MPGWVSRDYSPLLATLVQGFEVLNVQNAGYPFLLEDRLNPHPDLHLVKVNLAQHVDKTGVGPVQLNYPVGERGLHWLCGSRLVDNGIGNQGPLVAHFNPLAELGKAATGHTLYLLDEPTTGLHFADIQNLLNVLQRLCDMGNTVVVIEHNLDVVKVADYIIDLGPEGGDAGGRVVVAGQPEQIIKNKKSYTAKFLKAKLVNSE